MKLNKIAPLFIFLSSMAATSALALGEREFSFPETDAEVQTTSKASSTVARMKCFVDTPAYDLYTYDYCYNSGSARFTTAVFTIEGGPTSNFWVDWGVHNSQCSPSSKTCFLPIRWFQHISVTAAVMAKGQTIGTNKATAVAEYESPY